MQSKLLRIISLVLLSVIIIAITAVMMFFFTNTDQEEIPDLYETHVVYIYYLNPTANRLESESRTIHVRDRIQLVQEVAVALVTGPSRSTFLTRSVPENVSIIEVTLSGDIAGVNFSEEYNYMSTIEELFCRAAVVWTLTGLDFIENVVIKVGDEPIRKSNGEEIGLLNRGNVILDPNISPNQTSMETIQLFFSDMNGLWLVQEERTIEVEEGTPIEIYVMQALIDGTESDATLSFIPENTQLIGIETIDGVSYVNLSREFVEEHSVSQLEAMFTILSVVNSLTYLPHIDSIVFKIEGTQITDFKGFIDLSMRLEHDESMILRQ